MNVPCGDVEDPLTFLRIERWPRVASRELFRGALRRLRVHARQRVERPGQPRDQRLDAARRLSVRHVGPPPPPGTRVRCKVPRAPRSTRRLRHRGPAPRQRREARVGPSPKHHHLLHRLAAGLPLLRAAHSTRD